MKQSKNKFGETIEDHENGIMLNLSYWDCECKENYIKPIEQKRCIYCNAAQDDMPNSRANEVENQRG